MGISDTLQTAFKWHTCKAHAKQADEEGTLGWCLLLHLDSKFIWCGLDLLLSKIRLTEVEQSANAYRHTQNSKCQQRSCIWKSLTEHAPLYVRQIL